MLDLMARILTKKLSQILLVTIKNKAPLTWLLPTLPQI